MSLHGAASWPSTRELTAAGLLEPSETALRLGYDRTTGKPLYFGGDQHVFTHALPGAGKTIGAVLPTLATYTGSIVVTDPKGALTAQTAALRRDTMGHRIVVLNPWADEMKTALGVDLGNTGFDPLAFLRADDPALYDNIEMIAAVLCPTPHDAPEPYWCDCARSIIAGCMLFLVRADGQNCTLPELYRLVRQVRGKPTKESPTPKGWTKLAIDMLTLNDPAFEAYASEILSTLESEKQWAGVVGKVHTSTQIYAPHKPLGQHVVKNEFDPADLKREKVTVYIVIPAKRRDANKSWLGLVMALCAEAVGNPGPSVPVLLLAEEFANLGYVPSMLRAMAEYREAGLRCWIVVQDLHQLRRIYGRDGAQEIINLCGIKQFFRVDDLELARNLEAIIGTYTAVSSSKTDGWSDREEKAAGQKSNKSLSNSLAYSEIGVPLIRAQDILSLSKHLQIITAAGTIRPILAILAPYYQDTDLRDVIAPNPYRPELPPLETIKTVDHSALSAGIVLAFLSFIVPFFLTGWISIALGVPDQGATQLGMIAGLLGFLVFFAFGCWAALSERRKALKPAAADTVAAPEPVPTT